MPGFHDVYCLASARTVEEVELFLALFAPAREPSAEDYPIPQYAEQPDLVFKTADELIAYCVKHPAVENRVYWRCLANSDPAYAMIFFTPDGGLILGLSVWDDPGRWFADLLGATGRTTGWVGHEQPPPDTVAEFTAASITLAQFISDWFGEGAGAIA